MILTTKNNLRFGLSEPVEDVLRSYLRLVVREGNLVPSLVAAGDESCGFIFGSYTRSQLVGLSGADEFEFEGRTIFVVLSDNKRKQLDGAVLERRGHILVAANYEPTAF